MITTALILAGGRGERFWPRSRKSLPKQFLSLTNDGKTMIQLTVERILPMVHMADIYIATNEEYRGLVKAQFPELPCENILCEPVGRNTAPCIGLGAMHISKKHKEALMMVFPADHIIKHRSIFLSALKDACVVAESGENLVTIGITPDEPETGYGYIKFDSESSENHAFCVEKFVEKPDLETAKSYVESEQYLWNSGIFAWKISTILKNMETLIPETYAGLLKIRESIGNEVYDVVLQEEFPKFEAVSVDYGIMEHAKNIFTISGSFDWDDVGSWLAMERINPFNEFGNVVTGNLVTINTQNCILQGGQKLIAAVGLQDLIVVDTDDALLICDKESAGDIRKVLENLRMCNRTEYI